ncbi:MAG: cell division protein ZapA [Nitrosomonadaceae bacterium]|nr:cell division protein ZapA [Nitrosomonadaceae bacterium]|tara:strand:- start:695 stop:1003 length:309 start_codon:yes stop_codon:yes gene_type:complete
MAKNSAVDVAIMGREFRFTCPEEEREELLQAAAYLDKKMCEISEDGKVVGSERIAIMAGLNIAHEFLSAKTRGGSDMGNFKRKIDHMQTLLDKAVLDQSKLF